MFLFEQDLCRDLLPTTDTDGQHDRFVLGLSSDKY